MILLDGKKVSAEIRSKIKKNVKDILENGQHLRAPHLAAILVGDNKASETYVKNKILACKEVGYTSSLLSLDESTTEKVLLNYISSLNDDQKIDGFIVQLPLPCHISVSNVIQAISPEKDVDGFHPDNVGKMALQMPGHIPATPKGILHLLNHYEVPTFGKHCVVVGRSNIVGSPTSVLMSRDGYPGNCTVTLTHINSKDTPFYIKMADIVIVAVGKPNFITADMILEGTVVIDVGINRTVIDSKSGFKLVGDVDFVNVAPKCSYITPVPGGVGPMTIAALLENTYNAWVNGYLYQ